MRWHPDRLRQAGQQLMDRTPAGVTTASPKVRVPNKTDDSTAKETVSSAANARQLATVEQELLSYDQASTHLHALNALMGRWGAQSYAATGVRLTTPETFSRLAAKGGLRLTFFKGTLDEAIRFDLPFLAVTRVSGDLGSYCLAVTAVRDDAVTVAPALFGKSVLDKKELASLVNGTFYLVWKNVGRIPVTITPGERRYEVGTLQRLLRQAGPYHGPFDGIYGRATEAAVREFQRLRGIAADDMVGELTLAALVSYDRSARIPSLKGN